MCKAPKPNTCRAKVFGIAHCKWERRGQGENGPVSTIISVPCIWAQLFYLGQASLFFLFSGILLINVFISYPLNKLNCILYLLIKLLMLLCTLLCVQRRFLLSPHNLAASCLPSPVASASCLPPCTPGTHCLEWAMMSHPRCLCTHCSLFWDPLPPKARGSFSLLRKLSWVTFPLACPALCDVLYQSLQHWGMQLFILLCRLISLPAAAAF